MRVQVLPAVSVRLCGSTCLAPPPRFFDWPTTRMTSTHDGVVRSETTSAGITLATAVLGRPEQTLI